MSWEWKSSSTKIGCQGWVVIRDFYQKYTHHLYFFKRKPKGSERKQKKIAKKAKENLSRTISLGNCF